MEDLSRRLAAVAAATTLAFRCGAPGADAASQQIAQAFKLDEARLNGDLGELTASPHPFGSPRQAVVTAWLERRIGEAGATARREAFTATVPNPAALAAAAGAPVATTLERSGANLWALGGVRPEAPCVVALASHFDTKDVAGSAYVCANDSGSSTAVLLQLLSYLHAVGGERWLCDVAGVFFDGEEAVLPNWTDGESFHPARAKDHTYGSRYAAGRLTACTLDGRPARCLPKELGGKPLVALVLMDMIGSPGLAITRDANSTPALVALAASGAGALGQASIYDQHPHAMEDDHLPYLQAGVPALDLIDFNHLAWWHRAGDDPATLAPASMEQAGRLAAYVAAVAAAAPERAAR